MPAVEDAIAATPGTVLHRARRPARPLRTSSGSSTACARGIMDGVPLQACWTLLPADDQTDRPLIDGHAVPVLTPNEWARIPRSWLKNLHRAAAEGAA